jgi:hypothetical protein
MDPDSDPDPSIFIIDLQDTNKKLIKKTILCSARDWQRSGLLEENPQSGCTEICASLKGPL